MTESETREDQSTPAAEPDDPEDEFECRSLVEPDDPSAKPVPPACRANGWGHQSTSSDPRVQAPRRNYVDPDDPDLATEPATEPAQGPYPTIDETQAQLEPDEEN